MPQIDTFWCASNTPQRVRGNDPPCHPADRNVEKGGGFFTVTIVTSVTEVRVRASPQLFRVSPAGLCE